MTDEELRAVMAKALEDVSRERQPAKWQGWMDKQQAERLRKLED